MAKLLESAELSITTNTVIMDYLRELTLTGRFGTTENQAAERLIGMAILKLIHDGDIKPRQGTPPVEESKK